MFETCCLRRVHFWFRMQLPLTSLEKQWLGIAASLLILRTHLRITPQSLTMLLKSIVYFLVLCTATSFLQKSVKRSGSFLSMASSFYDIVEKDGKGNDVAFSTFKGKVVYGVNVASKCGYTASGYALLSKLASYKEKGIEVAIFPCNQFGGQVSLLNNK